VLEEPDCTLSVQLSTNRAPAMHHPSPTMHAASLDAP